MFDFNQLKNLFYEQGNPSSVFRNINQVNPRTGDPIAGNAVNLAVFIYNVINYLIYGLGILAFLALIYGGFLYITAADDPNKVDIAKKIIIGAIVGIIIVSASWIIYRTTTGVLLQGANAL
ncbi:hypothetical protein COT77_01535 [Candidatus Berkelbacteria bacterium CG10_big_fil_rev_8_21_14_0_10_41_12]|uniref:Uncharacterized protein n=1 Tax=Candidatus Berkelbacteria bacterium CG10_big_fil_rev_8_21_14_0_10_41_12 TaxID=1974513 RepID=A0A2M6WXC6_9BACT|nr:MAG: hypothetical protein COT77_01535 [Candidatus Berkelbacteria bacterium CG10_big_fil_rev_8_21_14_0_10_41_12]